ncbi:hypothetical protein [Acinetobacter sp.]|uniref:hypothetical protein n=1 Tax=Acinetobacter sp. TaxID=472 RepID=UPI00264761E0|nr:hypothetical protein [Acinetobacter sp.]MDN5512733.1 hypothetical protein [Acinetobacter sp.]MDN5525382.1 hypothetical protein [Acinetobacter sp.]
MAEVKSLENLLKAQLTTEAKECEKLNTADKIASDKLRVKFAILYLQLQQTVTSTGFSELHAEDVHQIEKLKANAAEVYTSIVSARQLGKDYLFAAFTYFATYVSEQLDETGYLLLRVSYFFYMQYQSMCLLDDSAAKQKEICDLLRYICKPLVEPNFQLQEESSEKSDSRKILQCCLDFVLQQEKLSGKIYEKWTGFIQDLSLKEKNFCSYLRALTIIFKRLSDGIIVHRKINRSHITKVKKLKPVRDWPSQQEEVEEDYPSKDKINLTDLPADITFDPWVVIDEEGEIDAIEQGWQIETTDPGTGRFFRFVNEYATHMLRHRQRRLQPLVTNSYYMSQDVIQHLFYLLNGELNSQDPDSSAMAAACLLSLSSGLSPVALLNYEQLIEKGMLLKTGSAKRPEYQVRLYLAITQQKNESLMPHQLNHMVSHELYLSSSWFEYLHLRCGTAPVTVQEVNQYLKKCIAGQQLGSITVEKLQAQLYFHVFHHTFNEYIAHVLSGKDSSHDLPGSFYGGVAKKQLNEKYRIYLNTLCRPDTEAEIKIVEQQFESSSEADTTRLGSQLALTPDFVSDFFQQLHKVCHEKIQLHQHLIERINAYSLWMWHISLLCLTRRPQEHLLGECSAYDLDLRLLYVNDKKNSQSRKDGRFIPLAKFFTQAFKHYLDFLNSVVTHYADLLKFVFKKNITLEDLFGKVIVYPGSLPVTAQAWDSPKIRIKPLSRAWVNEALSRYVSAPIYNNWLRHFAMNMLMDHGVAFNVIQALYGHDQRDQELFYRYSSASLYQYICHVSQGIDEMIKILQVEHLSSPMPEKDKAHDKA